MKGQIMRVETNETAACVLLVDDDAAVRTLAKRFLESSGYQVLAAGNPIEAMLLLAEYGPADLLITDVVMPALSGPEVAEMVEKKYPGVKVLFVSGYPLAVAAGSENRFFLQKPFTIATLAAKVREVLDATPALV